MLRVDLPEQLRTRRRVDRDDVSAGQHELHARSRGGARERRDVLAGLEVAHVQNELLRQREPRPHRHDRGVRRRREPGPRRLEHDVGVAAEPGLHPFGRERGDRDHRVGPTDRPARRHLLPDATGPAEGRGLVEQREIVHRRNRRRSGTKREVDIERVHEVGRSGAAQALDRAPHPFAIRANPRLHRSGQLPLAALLDDRGEVGVDLRRQGSQQLAAVGLNATATGVERERVQDDVRSHVTTIPSRSQKKKSIGKISK